MKRRPDVDLLLPGAIAVRASMTRASNFVVWSKALASLMTIAQSTVCFSQSSAAAPPRQTGKLGLPNANSYGTKRTVWRAPATGASDWISEATVFGTRFAVHPFREPERAETPRRLACGGARVPIRTWESRPNNTSPPPSVKRSHCQAGPRRCVGRIGRFASG